MKKNLSLVLAAAALALSSSAYASTITIEAASATPGHTFANAAAYQAAVDQALLGSSYGKTTIATYDNINHGSLFSGGRDFAMKSTITFGVSQADAGLWQFRAGVDFGLGGALFINDVAVDSKSHDMWWGGQYTNASQFLGSSVNLGAGNHTMTIYGFEGCCDGTLQAQFMAPGGRFTTFSASDNLVSAVPEPETYAMFLAGLGMVGFVTRRRRIEEKRSA